MATGTPLFESAISWIRQGYPEGIPPTEFPPLLALLVRVLDEAQVTDVVLQLAKYYDVENPVTEDRIREAIANVIRDEPNSEEINQVASRLASAGWPLATPAR
ncbi:DUF3349 domain-containing protein [Gordonia insulae]|uniref:DUF3349 domain-containing protein n=1 Tax=Gordonia insulae TaxID=2420509 RepID=A0A3G8JTS1_9ACTN|nr:DUF3349 domain-containing protein [Gordonia insulae]AZG48115.1 hypothetical protein D7316_04728 [Gordonia insulae]